MFSNLLLKKRQTMEFESFWCIQMNFYRRCQYLRQRALDYRVLNENYLECATRKQRVSRDLPRLPVKDVMILLSLGHKLWRLAIDHRSTRLSTFYSWYLFQLVHWRNTNTATGYFIPFFLKKGGYWYRGQWKIRTQIVLRSGQGGKK